MKNKKEKTAPLSPDFYLQMLAFAAAAVFFIPLATEVLRYTTLRLFWNDEVLSYWILRRNFGEMLQAIYSGFDGMLPLFYISSWPLVQMFPDSEAAPRWLQVIPALIAPWVVFELIRRRFSLFAAAVAVMPTVLFFSQYSNLSWHLRAYGFLFLASALAIWALDVAAGNRTGKWIAINATIQFFLVGIHPFGIFYCGLLGLARFISDWVENRKLFNTPLLLSYIPAGLMVAASIPAILVAQKLVHPKPWQPPTSIQTLQTILFPSISSIWFLVFLVLVLLPLVLSKNEDKPTAETPPNRLFLAIVPLAFLGGTLAVWAYSLYQPLYLDRYFCPNIWAWCILLAFLFQKISTLAANSALRFSLAASLLVGLPFLFQTLSASGEKLIRDRIEADHILLGGTRDSELVDPKFPVFTSDLNVFMERLHYNPHSLDYRTVFDRVRTPVDPNISHTERLLSEGMIALGMPSEKLLDPSEAVKVAIQKGGATYIGVKRTKETVDVLKRLESQGFTIKSREVNIGGAILYVESCKL